MHMFNKEDHISACHDCGRWTMTKDEPPDLGKPVLCRVQHFHTKGVQDCVLKRVDEDDVSWRFPDDGSEISYDWDVIQWIRIPDPTRIREFRDCPHCGKRYAPGKACECGIVSF